MPVKDNQPKNQEAVAPAVAEPAAEGKQEVVVRDLIWVTHPRFHSKQQGEGGDTMGGYQQYLALTSPDNKTYILREGSEPTETLDPLQRRMLTLIVAAYETFGFIKGNFYLDTFAYNLTRKDVDFSFLGKLAKDGWHLTWTYGGPDTEKPSRVHASMSDLYGFIKTATGVRNSTLEKFPPAVEVKTQKAVVEERVEVELVL
jgi:hypothetical protein